MDKTLVFKEAIGIQHGGDADLINSAKFPNRRKSVPGAVGAAQNLVSNAPCNLFVKAMPNRVHALLKHCSLKTKCTVGVQWVHDSES
jgi:hypothetical protein